MNRLDLELALPKHLGASRARIESWKQPAARPPEPARSMIDFATSLSDAVRTCRWRGKDPEPWRLLCEAALDEMQKWWPAQWMPLADLKDVCMYEEVVCPERLASVRDWTGRGKLPILILRETENRLQLQDGHHRLKIARELGDGHILAIIVDLALDDAAERHST